MDRTFLHALQLDNWVACHNLSNSGSLVTPNLLGASDPGLLPTHRHIDEISIEELRSCGPTGNALAPRVAKYVIPSAIWDSGLTMVDGYGNAVETADGKRMNTIDMRDTEIAFEAGRRRYAPTSASRWSCIWLADDSAEGEAVVRSMFGQSSRIRLVKMRITHQLALTRADSRWFDDYRYSRKGGCIENYWSQVPHPDGPLWEWLVDGRVELVDPDDWAFIRDNGRRIL
jgi:hypothetical protein